MTGSAISILPTGTAGGAAKAMRLLVTGTTGGIGGAVKRVAEAAGHAVVAVNRADFAALESLALEGPFDALVFATGTCPVKPLTLLSDAEFEETLAVNCGLFVKLLRLVVKRKLYGPAGLKALAVSSVSASEGWAGGAAYCASKGALSALCRALDAELRPRGISIAAIEPRYVKTAMFDRCAGRMGVDPKLAQDPDELAREILKGVE